MTTYTDTDDIIDEINSRFGIKNSAIKIVANIIYINKIDDVATLQNVRNKYWKGDALTRYNICRTYTKSKIDSILEENNKDDIEIIINRIVIHNKVFKINKSIDTKEELQLLLEECVQCLNK